MSEVCILNLQREISQLNWDVMQLSSPIGGEGNSPNYAYLIVLELTTRLGMAKNATFIIRNLTHVCHILLMEKIPDVIPDKNPQFLLTKLIIVS